jgi:hypothetical protein
VARGPPPPHHPHLNKVYDRVVDQGGAYELRQLCDRGEFFDMLLEEHQVRSTRSPNPVPNPDPDPNPDPTLTLALILAPAAPPTPTPTPTLTLTLTLNLTRAASPPLLPCVCSPNSRRPSTTATATARCTSLSKVPSWQRHSPVA